MAERRPLVIVNNRTTELPAGDTLPAGTTGTGTGEIAVADGMTAPPVMLTSEAEDDFLYAG